MRSVSANRVSRNRTRTGLARRRDGWARSAAPAGLSAVTLVAAAALAGCGPDASEGADRDASAGAAGGARVATSPPAGPLSHPGPGSPQTVAAIRDAVSAYVGSVLGGDAPTAYGLLSARCRQAMPMADFAAGLRSGAAAPLSGFRAEVAGGRAAVSYTAGPLRAHDETWVREAQGEWRKDDC